MLYSTLTPKIAESDFGIFYSPPPNFLTKKQLLKRLLRPTGPCVGQVLYVFDEARDRHRGIDAVSADECETFRNKLELFGVDPCDHPMLHRLDQAGQLAQCKLYDVRLAEKITVFKREVEAQTLLEYMLFDGAHPKNFLTDLAPYAAKKEIQTWRREYSQPSLKKHLTAQQFYGPIIAPTKYEDDEGESVVQEKGHTFFLAPDLDRHSYTDPWTFRRFVLAVRNILENYFPQLHWHVEINKKNASVKFFGWSRQPMTIQQAKELAERMRAVLSAKLPDHDFSHLEIWPSSLRQIIAPLRLDKINLIGCGEVPKVVRRYKDRETGEWTKVSAYSAAAFLNWMYFEKTQVQEEHLAAALDQALSQPMPQKIVSAAKKTKLTKCGPGSTNPIVPYKGRFRQALVDFWTGRVVPPDDTLDKFVVPTLRVLFREGLDQDEAEDWVLNHLDDLPDKSFSDRLSGDSKRLNRDVGNWAKKIWSTHGVGGQSRPKESEQKLDATVEAWQRCGFVLHDPSTWDRVTSTPPKKVVWTDRLRYAVEQLAEVASCSRRQAKEFLNVVLSFVDDRSELALSMLGRLLEQCGIAGKSQAKRNAVRQVLVNLGLIVRTNRYFHDPASGYRHGDFFIVAGDILLVEDGEVDASGGVVPPTPSLSIYLSSNDEVTGVETHELLEEARRLRADERFRRRIWEFMRLQAA